MGRSLEPHGIFYRLNDRQCAGKVNAKKENSSINGAACGVEYFDCESRNLLVRQNWAKNTSVFHNCNANNNGIEFDFGIFEIAFTKNVVSSKFLQKYIYCLWWGLQNLSSYAQNLVASTYIVETLFCILIVTLGLILFAHSIGNMQVPFFSQMDDQLLDAICEHLVSSLSTEGTYIVREGDLVTEMLFIIRGRLESSTTNGGRAGFFNSITLRPVISVGRSFLHGHCFQSPTFICLLPHGQLEPSLRWKHLHYERKISSSSRTNSDVFTARSSSTHSDSTLTIGEHGLLASYRQLGGSTREGRWQRIKAYRNRPLLL